MRAVIMAGGKGTRLYPYTVAIPKPLVPIGGDKTIVEIVIHQLKKAGFDHITVSVNHLSDLIMSYLGDGSKFGLKIDYSLEDKPLGTIAPLALIKDLPENFLVVNGDTLTNLDYRGFYDEHVKNNSRISITAKKREVKIDFGVLEFNSDGYLERFDEKPTHHSHVAMGVNCFNRSILEKVPKGEKYGFDDLMRDSLLNKEEVRVHDFDGFWLDIGRPEDYQYVNENYEDIKKILSL